MKNNIIVIILITLSILAIFVLLFPTVRSLPSNSAVPSILPSPTNITVDPLLLLINNERTSKGLKPFMESSELKDLTTKRATDLYNSGQWNHNGFNEAASKGEFKGVVEENLARGIASDNDVLIAWLNSPSHAKNLFADCKYAGVGRAGTGKIGRLGADLYVVLWLAECK